MSRTSLALVGLFGLLPLMGCPPDPEKEETGTDTADSGGSGDGTEVDPSAALSGDDATINPMTSMELHATLDGVVGADSFSGTSTYSTAYDGVTACDSESTVTGTPYTGTCDGCDFAFAITTTATRDDSTADCTNYASLSLTGDEAFHDMLLAYIPEYVYSGYYGDYTYYEILQVGYSYYSSYYGYDFVGPYWSTAHFQGSENSTFSFDGTNLAWTFDYATTYSTGTNYYTYCDYTYPDAADDFTANYGGTGSFPCGTGEGDIWTFDAPEGATANILVDTVSSDTAFDIVMWVNGPDSCTLGYADDTVDCTFPPPAYQCPSMQLEDLDAGTHQIVVAPSSYASGSCAGDVAEYSLSIQVLAP